MPQVIAYADISNPRKERAIGDGHFSWRSDFLRPATGVDAPMAFLAEGTPNRVLGTHFHEVDQFQVVYKGDGRLGAHPLRFAGVHFSRAYTPYGPITYGEKGLGFITLRAHNDPGQQGMPQKRSILESIPNRKPWQLTVMPDFSMKPVNGVATKAMESLKDDRGLSGHSMVLSPGAKAQAPAPSGGDGQYILVMKGSILHENQEKKTLTIIWVGKDDGAVELHAGPQGCEVIVLNFPKPGGGAPAQAASDHGPSKSHQCVLCAFVYDEAEGLPEAGIAAGTRWADVPVDFRCPDCDAPKCDFKVLSF